MTEGDDKRGEQVVYWGIEVLGMVSKEGLLDSLDGTEEGCRRGGIMYDV